MEPRKITLGTIGTLIAWIIGIIFLLAAIAAFTTLGLLKGIIIIVIGLAILPLTNTLLRKYLKTELSTSLRAIIIITGMMLLTFFPSWPQPLDQNVSGLSIETAIVVPADNEAEGVAWEYQYLRDNACTDKGGFRDVDLQSLDNQNGHMFDRMSISCKNGGKEMYYFQIDNFFGKI